MNEVRLIDANALENAAIPCETHNGALTELCVPLYQIRNAPTVTPDMAQVLAYESGKASADRPTGEWYYSCQNGWHCSICQQIVKDMPTVMGKANFDYCPNCGVKMKKEAENEK